MEVSSRQWEMLIELDRLEYNSNHNYSRHTVRMPDSDEDAMPHAMREQHIDKGIPFTYFIHENQDKNKLYSALSEKERTVLRLCEEEDYTQAEAARELRVSQGYISRLLKRAREKRFYLKNKNASRDEIIWNYWQYFSSYGEIPDYTDVILEFILRSMAGDFLPLLHWFSSFGELCRFVLKNVALEPEEIAPWKLPRDRHATISVLKHRAEDLQAVDDYLSVCEKQFSYLKQMSGTTEQAWQSAIRSLNAELFLMGKNTLLECLQFGGN